MTTARKTIRKTVDELQDIVAEYQVIVLSKTHTLMDGFYKEFQYNPDTEQYKLITEGYYKQGNKEGIWKTYYRDTGALATQGTYKNDVMDGDWYYFYNTEEGGGETNKIQIHEIYKAGLLVYAQQYM